MASKRQVKESKLFQSLLAKNYKKAKRLVKIKTPSGSTEQINFERQSYFDTCKSLFEEDLVENFKCERVNFPSIMSESLLYFAVVLNKPLHVKFLLQRGANPNYTFGGISVLSKAVQLNHLEFVKILISFKANIGSSLLYAVECCRYKIVKWLLGTVKIDGRLVDSAMISAIKLEDVGMVKVLCHFAERDNLRLALKHALLYRKHNVARVLLELGADPNCKVTTPLEYAIRTNQKVAVELLIEFKADVNQQFPGGITPLHVAISRSGDWIIKILLKANADAHISYSGGSTAFERACYCGVVKRIKLFIKYGFFEPTGFVFAAKNGKDEALMYFLNNFPDLDVNVRDRENCTALYWVARLQRDCRILMSLLERGADINMANNTNSYPILLSPPCLRHDCPIRKHFLKLSLLGYGVNEATLTTSPLLQNMEELGATDRIKFEEEIEKLKQIVISSYPRKMLFSVLLMKLRQVAKFSNNKILLEIYERNGGDFRKEFPNFGFLLNLNFSKGVQHRILTSQARGYLIQYGLPEILENKIFEYLSKEELKIIIEILRKEKRRFSERIANKCL